MPSKDTKILEFNQCQQCDKIQFITYADLEYLIKNGCKNNSEKLSATKVGEHIHCGYFYIYMSTIWAFGDIENKYDVYEGEDNIKKIREPLRKSSMKINNFEKKKVIPLTHQHQKSYEKAKICYIFKKTSKINTLMTKHIVELEIIFIIQRCCT